MANIYIFLYSLSFGTSNRFLTTMKVMLIEVKLKKSDGQTNINKQRVKFGGDIRLALRPQSPPPSPNLFPLCLFYVRLGKVKVWFAPQGKDSAPQGLVIV